VEARRLRRLLVEDRALLEAGGLELAATAGLDDEGVALAERLPAGGVGVEVDEDRGEPARLAEQRQLAVEDERAQVVGERPWARRSSRARRRTWPAASERRLGGSW
jgi:hypothetical protein